MAWGKAVRREEGNGKGGGRSIRLACLLNHSRRHHVGEKSIEGGGRGTWREVDTPSINKAHTNIPSASGREAERESVGSRVPHP